MTTSPSSVGLSQASVQISLYDTSNASTAPSPHPPYSLCDKRSSVCEFPLLHTSFPSPPPLPLTYRRALGESWAWPLDLTSYLFCAFLTVFMSPYQSPPSSTARRAPRTFRLPSPHPSLPPSLPFLPPSLPPSSSPTGRDPPSFGARHQVQELGGRGRCLPWPERIGLLSSMEYGVES